jgi:hypothetical protein
MFDATTESWYASLPEHFRAIDPKTEWALKKYLSGAGRTLNDLRVAINEIAYDPSADPPDNVSTLIDSTTMPSAWIPWLAQIIGIRNIQRLPITRQRAVLQALPASSRGAFGSWAEAVQQFLAGNKYVRIHNFSEDSGDIGGATMWDVLVITKFSETLTNDVPRLWSEGRSTAAWYSAYNLNTQPEFEEDEDFFNGTALRFETNATGEFEFYPLINDTVRIPAPDADPFSVFFKAALIETGTTEITLTVEFFDGADLSLGTQTQDFVLSDVVATYGDTFTTPANTETATIVFTHKTAGTLLNSDILFGEFGAREGDNLEWILETVSVPDIIEQANMKPAGVVVHHETFTAPWDDVEAANPDWDEWDSKNWYEIEEAV